MKLIAPSGVALCCGNCLMMLGSPEAFCCAQHCLPTEPGSICEAWVSPEGNPLPPELAARL